MTWAFGASKLAEALKRTASAMQKAGNAQQKPKKKKKQPPQEDFKKFLLSLSLAKGWIPPKPPRQAPKPEDPIKKILPQPQKKPTPSPERTPAEIFAQDKKILLGLAQMFTPIKFDPKVFETIRRLDLERVGLEPVQQKITKIMESRLPYHRAELAMLGGKTAPQLGEQFFRDYMKGFLNKAQINPAQALEEFHVFEKMKPGGTPGYQKVFKEYFSTSLPDWSDLKEVREALVPLDALLQDIKISQDEFSNTLLLHGKNQNANKVKQYYDIFRSVVSHLRDQVDRLLRLQVAKGQGVKEYEGQNIDEELKRAQSEIEEYQNYAERLLQGHQAISDYVKSIHGDAEKKVNLDPYFEIARAVNAQRAISKYQKEGKEQSPDIKQTEEYKEIQKTLGAPQFETLKAIIRGEKKPEEHWKPPQNTLLKIISTYWNISGIPLNLVVAPIKQLFRIARATGGKGLEKNLRSNLESVEMQLKKTTNPQLRAKLLKEKTRLETEIGEVQKKFEGPSLVSLGEDFYKTLTLQSRESGYNMIFEDEEDFLKNIPQPVKTALSILMDLATGYLIGSAIGEGIRQVLPVDEFKQAVKDTFKFGLSEAVSHFEPLQKFGNEISKIKQYISSSANVTAPKILQKLTPEAKFTQTYKAVPRENFFVRTLRNLDIQVPGSYQAVYDTLEQTHRVLATNIIQKYHDDLERVISKMSQDDIEKFFTILDGGKRAVFKYVLNNPDDIVSKALVQFKKNMDDLYALRKGYFPLAKKREAYLPHRITPQRTEFSLGEKLWAKLRGKELGEFAEYSPPAEIGKRVVPTALRKQKLTLEEYERRFGKEVIKDPVKLQDIVFIEEFNRLIPRMVQNSMVKVYGVPREVMKEMRHVGEGVIINAGGKEYVVDKTLVDFIRAQRKPIFDDTFSSSILKLGRRYNDLMRAWRRIGFPGIIGYLPKRAIGDIQRSFVALKEAAKNVGIDLTDDEIKTMIRYFTPRPGYGLEGGILSSRPYARGFRWNPLSGRFIGLEPGAKLERALTKFEKEKLFGLLLRKTKDPAEALRLTNKWLFEFSRGSPFEKRVLRSIIPYYPYMRQNVAQALQSLLYPEIYAPIIALGNALTERKLPPVEGTLPSYFATTIPTKIKIAGKPIAYDIGSIFPFERLGLTTMTGIGGMETPSELIENLNPAFRLFATVMGANLGEPEVLRTERGSLVPVSKIYEKFPEPLKRLLGIQRIYRERKTGEGEVRDIADILRGKPLVRELERTIPIPIIETLLYLTREGRQALPADIIRRLSGQKIYAILPELFARMKAEEDEQKIRNLIQQIKGWRQKKPAKKIRIEKIPSVVRMREVLEKMGYQPTPEVYEALLRLYQGKIPPGVSYEKTVRMPGPYPSYEDLLKVRKVRIPIWLYEYKKIPKNVEEILKKERPHGRRKWEEYRPIW